MDEQYSSRNYWKFSLNEHAMYDFPAFFHKIKTIKRSEGVDDYKLTVTAHSLGAAVTLMYLVFRRSNLTRIPIGFDDLDLAERSDSLNDSVLYKEGVSPSDADDDDHIVSALLLSPAGMHIKHPVLVYFAVPLIETVLFFLPLYVIKAPTRQLGRLMAKLWEDVKQTPTSKFLLGFFTALLLGGEVENHPIHRVEPHKVFEGTSITIYRHFVQIWRSATFQAFDYGSVKNEQIYGSRKPLQMLSNYSKIDIPVNFVYGANDLLIPAENIKAHFDAMSSVRPQLASLTEFDTGHLEFTVGLRDYHIDKLLELIGNERMEI